MAWGMDRIPLRDGNFLNPVILQFPLRKHPNKVVVTDIRGDINKLAITLNLSQEIPYGSVGFAKFNTAIVAIF
jgi:hypothetical protein